MVIYEPYRVKSIFTDLLRTFPHPSKFSVTVVKIEENIKVPQEMTKISIQIKVIFIILNITILYKIFHFNHKISW